MDQVHSKKVSTPELMIQNSRRFKVFEIYTAIVGSGAIPLFIVITVVVTEVAVINRM